MHVRAAQDRKFLDPPSAYGINWYLLMWQYAALFYYFRTFHCFGVTI